MAIIRVEKTKNYTVMSNYHLSDRNLSLKAKGLLSVMLSLPDDWDYSVDGLVAICKENVSAVKTALVELKVWGYLQVIKHLPSVENGGRIDYEYVVYEQPQQGKIQGVENLSVENQYVENQKQLNTKQSNTKQQSTNNRYNAEIDEIVAYLNEKAGTAFRTTTPKTRQLIITRLSEGYTVADFRKVIDNKVAEWNGDSKMQAYLRPETLFGTKFESYLQQRVATKSACIGGKEIERRVYTDEDYEAMFTPLDED